MVKTKSEKKTSAAEKRYYNVAGGLYAAFMPPYKKKAKRKTKRG